MGDFTDLPQCQPGVVPVKKDNVRSNNDSSLAKVINFVSNQIPFLKDTDGGFTLTGKLSSCRMVLLPTFAIDLSI